MRMVSLIWIIITLMFHSIRKGLIMDDCYTCPYWGVVDVDANDNLIWSCVRRACINIIDGNIGFVPLNEIDIYET